MQDFFKDWKVHALCVVIVLIAEALGVRKLQITPAVGFSLFPMLYAMAVGIVMGAWKLFSLETMKQASAYTTISVMFLTAKGDIVDKSMGFTAGGDDYVTKPFNATELLLRVEANIRRHKDTMDFAKCCNREGVTKIGDLEVHFDEYQVFVKGKPVGLTTKEFEIVAFLAMHPGKVFTRSQIQEYIWGEGESDVKTNSITVFVRKIREKIEENPSEPKYLLTVQRVGYKMADTLG